MLTPGVETAETALASWFVAFVDYGTNLWWHRLCRRGFRHVFAFAYDARAGAWVVFDPLIQGFVLRAATSDDIARLLDEVWRVRGRVLRCRAEGRAPARPRFFATCVTVIGHLLGLPRCAVFPHGLYRMLLRRGAVPAFERHGNDHARADASGRQSAG